MNTVELARLVWAARSEASRLHRLAVESERLDRELRARLDEGDARIYRCAGCGGWRYRGRSATCGYQDGPAFCPCGMHRDGRQVRRAA